MIREKEVSEKILNFVKEKVPESILDGIVFYNRNTAEYFEVYEGGNGEFAIRNIQIK